MTTPPAPQSNQNAGADQKSCPWCVLWNVAFAAERLQRKQYGAYSKFLKYRVEQLRDHAESVLILLANRETDCTGCRRSAQIQRGDYLGPERREWRAEMWQINPSMHFMMRQGSTETFQDDAK